jgi:hypothetical protein
VVAAAVRILSRMVDRPRAERPRRFRPLAEPMEARVVLSQVTLTRAIIDPIAIGRGPSALVGGPQPSSEAPSAQTRPDLNHGAAAPSGPGAMDTVEVNGQVELQPADTVLSGLSRRGSFEVALFSRGRARPVLRLWR